MNALEEIKRLYYNTTRSTVARDLARAVTLLKTLPSEEERERAAVYMDGLAQMRSEWAQASGHRDIRASGHRDSGTSGQRQIGSSGHQKTGSSGHRDIGKSGDRQTAKPKQSKMR